jgi:hypothetical protein
MRSPQAGVLAVSLWYKKDFSGLPGTTIDQPLHSAELVPMSSASGLPIRSSPAAGDWLPWQPAPSHDTAKTVLRMLAASALQAPPAGLGLPSGCPEQPNATKMKRGVAK